MLRKLVVFNLLALTVISYRAQAQFMGFEAGVRQQSATAETVGVSTNTEMAFQFGLIGAFPLQDKFLFRSGFLYTQRPITVKGTPDQKYSFNYFDIPLTFLWKFNDNGGVYGGFNLALVASADCSSCGNTSVDKKSAMPLVIGGTFKFAPDFGIDVYYEMMNKVNDDFKEARAVGANLLITID